MRKILKRRFTNRSIYYRRFSVRLASLVGITERETGVGKLGWHGNSTGFDRKNNLYFCKQNNFCFSYSA